MYLQYPTDCFPIYKHESLCKDLLAPATNILMPFAVWLCFVALHKQTFVNVSNTIEKIVAEINNKQNRAFSNSGFFARSYRNLNGANRAKKNSDPIFVLSVWKCQRHQIKNVFLSLFFEKK